MAHSFKPSTQKAEQVDLSELEVKPGLQYLEGFGNHPEKIEKYRITVYDWG